MTIEFWLAVISVLLTLCGTFAMLAYRDIARRMTRLEKQDKKLFSAVLTLLIIKPDDHVAIANALHALLSDNEVMG